MLFMLLAPQPTLQAKRNARKGLKHPRALFTLFVAGFISAASGASALVPVGEIVVVGVLLVVGVLVVVVVFVVVGVVEGEVLGGRCGVDIGDRTWWVEVEWVGVGWVGCWEWGSGVVAPPWHHFRVTANGALGRVVGVWKWNIDKIGTVVSLCCNGCSVWGRWKVGLCCSGCGVWDKWKVGLCGVACNGLALWSWLAGWWH